MELKIFSLEFLLLCSCVAFAASHAIKSVDRTLSGGQAESGQFKYQVSVRDSHNDNHFCSGALLNEYWIVTSAQCLQGNYARSDNVRVMLGTTHLNGTSGKFYDVDRVIAHPEYDGEKRRNDIGLVRATQAIEIDHLRIFPAEFPTLKTDYNMEHCIHMPDVRVSGWGSFESSRSGTDELRFRRNPILTRKSCRRQLGHVNGSLLTEQMFCVENHVGEGICDGDVGSPLVTDSGELIGIASWNGGCGKTSPDVYTKVFSHLKWLLQNVFDMQPC